MLTGLCWQQTTKCLLLFGLCCQQRTGFLLHIHKPQGSPPWQLCQHHAQSCACLESAGKQYNIQGMSRTGSRAAIVHERRTSKHSSVQP
jgi:hypothetical protein